MLSRFKVLRQEGEGFIQACLAVLAHCRTACRHAVQGLLLQGYTPANRKDWSAMLMLGLSERNVDCINLKEIA